LPELALIAATIAYGSTFVIVQHALEHATPVGFILLRFSVGTIVLAPFAFRRGFRRPGIDVNLRAFVLASIAFGITGFAGYWLQNVGLQHATTSNSAFITGLFVVFTPIIEVVVTRRAPDARVIAAIGVSAVGLFFLTGGSFDIHAGDLLTLGGSFAFAMWIFLASIFSQRFDAVALTAAQMLVLVLCSVPVVVIGGLGTVTGVVVAAALITGIVCSALAFTLQLWGQRYVEPSRAAVILLFEPVVAGFVGYAVGERLGVVGYAGAALILAGIFVAERGTHAAPARGGSGPGTRGT
jgi:drug/metabolite transporter (DMT)-like permease